MALRGEVPSPATPSEKGRGTPDNNLVHLRNNNKAPKPEIKDIAKLPLKVGMVSLDINPAEDAHVYPRMVDVVLKVNPLPDGVVSPEARAAHLRRTTPSVYVARNAATAGLRSVEGVPEEERPPHIQELIAHGETFRKYKGYSPTDYALVIERKKGFEGQVQAPRPRRAPQRQTRRVIFSGNGKRNRAPEVREDIELIDATETEIRVMDAYLAFNPAGNDFLHIGQTSVGIAAFPHSRENKAPSDLAKEARTSFFAKLAAARERAQRGVPLPVKMQEFLDRIYALPEYHGLPDRDLFSVTERAVTVRELKQKARARRDLLVNGKQGSLDVSPPVPPAAPVDKWTIRAKPKRKV